MSTERDRVLTCVRPLCGRDARPVRMRVRGEDPVQ